MRSRNVSFENASSANRRGVIAEPRRCPPGGAGRASGTPAGSPSPRTRPASPPAGPSPSRELYQAGGRLSGVRAPRGAGVGGWRAVGGPLGGLPSKVKGGRGPILAVCSTLGLHLI